MVGLNFSDEQEADKFIKAIETKIRDRQHRRQSKTCGCHIGIMYLCKY